MTKTVHQPHDKFFKTAMSNPRVAIDFFKAHLPQTIKELIDFGSLKFHKETFLETNLKLHAADVVYSANFAGRLGYIYLLVEQQTEPDKWLPLRMHNYLLGLLNYHHSQYPDSDLPLIYPLIFYNGLKPYKFSTDFFQLFDKQKLLMQKVWNEPIQLVDLQKIADEELRAHEWAGLMEFVFKHQFKRDMMQLMATIMAWVHEVELNQGYEFAKNVISYIINQIDADNIDLIIELAQSHLSSELEEETMTIAERFRLRGVEQGLQLARNEQARHLKNLLARGYPPQEIAEAFELDLEEVLALLETEVTE